MSAQAEIAAIIAEADSMYVHIRPSLLPLFDLSCINVSNHEVSATATAQWQDLARITPVSLVPAHI